MTNEQAQELDKRLAESNDTLYIAYKTESCKDQTVMVWLDSEYGDNKVEADNVDYYTTAITAEELNRKIGEMLHGGSYRRRVGLRMMAQLDDYAI